MQLLGAAGRAAWVSCLPPAPAHWRAGELGRQRPFCLCEQSGPGSTAGPDSAASFVGLGLAARPALLLAEGMEGGGSQEPGQLRVVHQLTPSMPS